MQKVEEDDLTHQFLRKLRRSEVVQFGFNAEVLNSLKLLTQLMELLAIKVEELISNLFNAERILKIIQSGTLRISSTVSNEALKLTDCGMARLVLTNKIGVPFCRSKIFGGLQAPILDLHLIVETHQRQTPLRITLGIEGNERCICVAVLNQLFCKAAVSASSVLNIASLLELDSHYNDFLLVRCLECANMSRAFYVRREVGKLFIELFRRNNADIGEYFTHQVNIVFCVIWTMQYRFYFLYNSTAHYLPPVFR